MQNSTKEPQYVFTNEDVARKSKLAATFLETRLSLNKNVDAANNSFVKRFYNLDHNAYLEGGAISAKVKELMGLSVSAALRCDDCISYHIIQSYRIGCNQQEVEDSLNIALIIGGSIVIPHLRRAYALISEVFA